MPRNRRQNEQPTDTADGVDVTQDQNTPVSGESDPDVFRPYDPTVHSPVTVDGETNPVDGPLAVGGDNAGNDSGEDAAGSADVPGDGDVASPVAVSGTDGEPVDLSGPDDAAPSNESNLEGAAVDGADSEDGADGTDASAETQDAPVEDQQDEEAAEKERKKVARRLARELRGPQSQKPSAGEPDPNDYRNARGEALGFVRNVAAGGAIPGNTRSRDFVNGLDNEDPEDDEE